MSDIRSKLSKFYSLEQLSAGNSVMHRLHPLTKILMTFTFLLCVMSMQRDAVTQLTPFLFYPIIAIGISEIPYAMVFRRTWIAMPFCLFAGITNLIANQTVVLQLYGISITAGMLSLISILLRTFLCVTAVLILIATTPFSLFTEQMRFMHIPWLLVALIEMVYRYLSVLSEEASSMVIAYQLRSPGAQRPDMRHFGSFVGMLLLRSFDRAERIYQAMQCRLYGKQALSYRQKQPFQISDILCSGIVCTGMILCRIIDIPTFLGGLWT